MTQTDVDPGREHFREEDWVDFARQLGDAQRRARVARHLEGGCRECEQTLRIWSAVLQVADQEDAAGPPEVAVQRMKERFSARRPSLVERLAAPVALLFDSFRAPQLAMRGPGSPTRQLLYGSGRYTIKLQVEDAADRLSIVGQLLDEDRPQGVLAGATVRAVAGKRVLDRDITSELGEFQLQPVRSERLQVSVDVPGIGTFPLAASGVTRGRGRDGVSSTEETGSRKRARPR